MLCSYRLNIDSITVASGGVSKQYKRGDHLGDIRESVLMTMIRLGQAVLAGEYIDLPTDAMEPSESPPEKRPPSPDLWKITAIEKLAVSKKAKVALASVGLNTVADILAFGSGHGTLTKIDGITSAMETAIQEAIEKIAK